jgi:hypothetical protein
MTGQTCLSSAERYAFYALNALNRIGSALLASVLMTTAAYGGSLKDGTHSHCYPPPPPDPEPGPDPGPCDGPCEIY